MAARFAIKERDGMRSLVDDPDFAEYGRRIFLEGNRAPTERRLKALEQGRKALLRDIQEDSGIRITRVTFRSGPRPGQTQTIVTQHGQFARIEAVEDAIRNLF